MESLGNAQLSVPGRSRKKRLKRSRFVGSLAQESCRVLSHCKPQIKHSLREKLGRQSK
jgi:hypothetical protein